MADLNDALIFFKSLENHFPKNIPRIRFQPT